MEAVFEHEESLSEGGEFEELCLPLHGGGEGIDVPPDPHGATGAAFRVGVHPWQGTAYCLSQQ